MLIPSSLSLIFNRSLSLSLSQTHIHTHTLSLSLSLRLVQHLKNKQGLDLRKQVCVITFYSGQVLCINRALRTSGLGRDGVRVMTVDSFQGSECDVVLLSFVRSNIRGNVGFVKDFQRLNVALTRARHLLVCVGCAQTLLDGGKGYKGYDNNGNKNIHNNILNDKNSNGSKDDTNNDSHSHSHLSNIIIDAKQRNRLFLESDLIL